MTNDLRSRLVNALRRKEVVVVVGAGVSIGATKGAKVASWPGLLEHGVEHLLGLNLLDDKGARRLRDQIEEGRTTYPDALILAANEIVHRLGGTEDGRFARWLRESVGALRAAEWDVLDGLDALRRAGAPLATTNYDGLLCESRSGLSPVPWTAKGRVQRVLRGEEDGVLHLHGHWQEPASVILDFSSYEKIVSDGHAQAMEQATAALKSLLFVGCGATLEDPNFRPLRDWLRRWFKGSQHDHFRLVTKKEAAALAREHGEDRIALLEYGEEHSELGPYLKELAKEVGQGIVIVPTPVATLPARRDRFGRDDLFEDLVQTLLADEPRPTPLLGGPGVGKSHLTICALHDPRVAAKYGDRRYFVRCDGAATAGAVLGEVAKALRIQLGADLLAGVHHHLAAGPVVLALDNFETPWEKGDLAAENLLEQLLVHPAVALVVSIRGKETPLRPAWRAAIEIDPLPPPPARELFVRAAGGKHADDRHLEDFVKALDGLSVALELLGYSAQAEDDLSSLWSRWQRKKTALLKRGGGGAKEKDAGISFELSIQGPRMTDEARRLLFLLGRLPDGMAHQDLEELLPEKGDEAAATLRGVGLAFNESGRLRVLAPIREHVAREHPPSGEDWAQCLGHYYHLATSLGPKVGTAVGAEATARLSGESSNLEALIREGLVSSEGVAAVEAAIGLTNFHRFSGLGSHSLLEQAAQKAQQQGDARLQARALKSLGDIHLDRSDHAAARAAYEQALPLFQQVGDLLGQANCIRSLGDIHLRRSDHPRHAPPTSRPCPSSNRSAPCSDRPTASRAAEKSLWLQEIGWVRAAFSWRP